MAKRKNPADSGGLAPTTKGPDPEAVYSVVQMLIGGLSDHDCRAEIRRRWPRQNVDLLMASALNHFLVHSSPDPRAVRGWALLASQDLYRRCVETADFQTALRVLRSIVELSDN